MCLIDHLFTGRRDKRRLTEGPLPEVAGHSAVASGGPLGAAAGEPLVGRQGPVNAPLDAGNALRPGRAGRGALPPTQYATLPRRWRLCVAPGGGSARACSRCPHDYCFSGDSHPKRVGQLILASELRRG